jgi:periplasmic protein TonB
VRSWTKSAWAGALLLSLLVHGGAAALLAGREDEIETAGGNPVDIAVLGNSFEDAVSAGELTDALEPETAAADQPTEVETAIAESVQSAVAHMASPASASAVEAPDVSEAEMPSVAASTVLEAEGTVAVPTAEVPQRQEPVQAAEPEASAVVEAETAPRADTWSTEATSVDTAEAVEPVEIINPVADAPIPVPRPDIEALKAERERREAERREQPQRQQAARPAVGAGGQSQADARRGDAAGSARGSAAQSSGQGSQAAAAGNAAASNYPGQVVSRLRRSLSYPAQARRQRITGEVHVAFTITAGGAVSGVRVVRSSGHPVLDEAALETVHRAAPFPAIPPAAGRSNWGFTVPLAFAR